MEWRGGQGHKKAASAIAVIPLARLPPHYNTNIHTALLQSAVGRSASDVELNLREYAQELVEKAERDGIFNSSGDAALNPATAPMVDRLFEGKYIVGTWRRSPYRPAAFPLALMGSMTSMNVSIGTFDSSGVVWRFTLKVSGALVCYGDSRAGAAAAPINSCILLCLFAELGRLSAGHL